MLRLQHGMISCFLIASVVLGDTYSESALAVDTVLPEVSPLSDLESRSAPTLELWGGHRLTKNLECPSFLHVGETVTAGKKWEYAKLEYKAKTSKHNPKGPKGKNGVQAACKAIDAACKKKDANALKCGYRELGAAKVQWESNVLGGSPDQALQTLHAALSEIEGKIKEFIELIDTKRSISTPQDVRTQFEAGTIPTCLKEPLQPTGSEVPDQVHTPETPAQESVTPQGILKLINFGRHKSTRLVTVVDGFAFYKAGPTEPDLEGTWIPIAGFPDVIDSLDQFRPSFKPSPLLGNNPKGLAFSFIKSMLDPKKLPSIQPILEPAFNEAWDKGNMRNTWARLSTIELCWGISKSLGGALWKTNLGALIGTALKDQFQPQTIPQTMILDAEELDVHDAVWTAGRQAIAWLRRHQWQDEPIHRVTDHNEPEAESDESHKPTNSRKPRPAIRQVRGRVAMKHATSTESDKLQ